MNNAYESIHPTMKQCGDIAESTGGLTKREYFAAMAMQGLCAHSGDYHHPDHLASDAVMYADALLKELDK